MTDDDNFGEWLGTLLRDEMSDVHSGPGMIDRLRGRARRNLMVRGGGAVAAVGVAVVIGVAVGLVVTPGADSGVTRVPDMVDVAYVRTHLTDSLNRSANYVVQEHSTWADGGHDDIWKDRATGRYRVDTYLDAARNQSLIETPEADGGARFFTIDYQHRTCYVWHQTAAQMQVPAGGFQDIPSGDPADIRNALAKGELDIVGKQKIDGHDTVRLRLKLTTDPNQFPVAMEIWVDATSYLPYRENISKTGKFDEATQFIVYTWRPRTPENLKVFDLTAPAGFTDRSR